MKIGDLVRTNAVYAASEQPNYDDSSEGLMGIVVDIRDDDESFFPIKVKMLHDGLEWEFDEEELDVAGEDANHG